MTVTNEEVECSPFQLLVPVYDLDIVGPINIENIAMWRSENGIYDCEIPLRIESSERDFTQWVRLTVVTPDENLDGTWTLEGHFLRGNQPFEGFYSVASQTGGLFPVPK